MKLSEDFDWLKNDPLNSIVTVKLARMSAGQEVIDLSMINPDLPPPRSMVDRLSAAILKSESNKYAVSRGVRKLREAFAAKYERTFGVRVNPESEVCVTFGAKDAIGHVLMLLGRTGTKVLLGKPTYPAHLSAVRIAKTDYDFFDISENEDAMVGQIEKHLSSGNFGCVLLNFPNNPTGLAPSARSIRSITEVARRFSVPIVNDFAYGDMVFEGGPAQSLLGADSKSGLMEVYTLSKAYSVPGWRIGAVVGGEDEIRWISKLKGHTDYGIYLPLQNAGAYGLINCDKFVGDLTREYARRARKLCTGLRHLGFEIVFPKGGAAVWAKLPADLGRDYQFCADLLGRTGISVLPGSVFGDEYNRYIRIALVANESRLVQVIEGIRTVGGNALSLDGCWVEEESHA